MVEGRGSEDDSDREMLGVAMSDAVALPLRVTDLRLLLEAELDADVEWLKLSVMRKESCKLLVSNTVVEALPVMDMPCNTIIRSAAYGTNTTLRPSKIPPINAFAALTNELGHVAYSSIKPVYTLMVTMPAALYGTIHTTLPSNAPPQKARSPFVNPDGQAEKAETAPDTASMRTTEADEWGTSQMPPRPSLAPPKKALTTGTYAPGHAKRVMAPVAVATRTMLVAS